jgi:hypothetical protein
MRSRRNGLLALRSIIASLFLAASITTVLASGGTAALASSQPAAATASQGPSPSERGPSGSICNEANDGQIIGPFGSGYYLICQYYQGAWQWIVYVPGCPAVTTVPGRLTAASC